jgi:hypothetical protein
VRPPAGQMQQEELHGPYGRASPEVAPAAAAAAAVSAKVAAAATAAVTSIGAAPAVAACDSSGAVAGAARKSRHPLMACKYSPLGTPRARYDEHSSKSSLSYETKVYQPVGESQTSEGDVC